MVEHSRLRKGVYELALDMFGYSGWGSKDHSDYAGEWYRTVKV
jgi:hypothetical protein